MLQSILALDAHPDDEVLGCGGTIAKLADEGATVHVAFLADGVYSHAGELLVQQEELHLRRTAAQKACYILGVKSVTFGDFHHYRMDMVALLDLTKEIEKLIAEHKPEMMFLRPECELTRTQDLGKTYHDAGRFYWGKASAWLQHKRLHTVGLGMVIPNWRVVDIDSEDDIQWMTGNALRIYSKHATNKHNNNQAST